MQGLGDNLIKKSMINMLIKLVDKGLLSVSDAAKETELSEKEFQELMEEQKKKSR